MAQVHGTMMGDAVLLSADPSAGVPVVFADAPEAPEGFVARSRFVDAGAEIRQAWSIVPKEGTAQDAAVALARMQAASLTDDQALAVAALYPVWNPGDAEYKKGERLLHEGTLYKVLQDHKPQSDWTPDTATSLYARVLPGQTGEVGEWVRPQGAHDAYAKGDRVTHGGKTWVSTADGNATEPGTTGATWEEVVE